MLRRFADPKSAGIPFDYVPVQLATTSAGAAPGSGVVLLALTQPRAASSAVQDQRLRSVVDRYMSLVWRVVRRSGLHPADADEVAQDVFWVFAQRASEVPEAAERSFLTSVALRVASDRRRSKWNRRQNEPLEPEFHSSPAPLPDETLARSRHWELLDEALDSLEQTHREVFILFELEQMTREEVAEALKIPAGTVASRLRRAREEFHVAVERLMTRKRRAP